MNETEVNQELKEIIVQRILTSELPKNLRVSIGNFTAQPMTLQQVVEHVKNEDEIGRKIIKIQLNYLKALKEGIISQIQNEQ